MQPSPLEHSGYLRIAFLPAETQVLQLYLIIRFIIPYPVLETIECFVCPPKLLQKIYVVSDGRAEARGEFQAHLVRINSLFCLVGLGVKNAKVEVDEMSFFDCFLF